MRSTFKEDDCIFLLKDLTGVMDFTPFGDKEKLISMGVNYSEMITREEQVDPYVSQIYDEILCSKAADLARFTGIVAERIYQRSKEKMLIVSLARAGSPIGALVKRYIRFKYGLNVPHFSISIIRGKGIDRNALDYICATYPDGVITFVDGWTGKGSISSELKKAITAYNDDRGTYISPDLAVLADPARVAAIAGTRDDVCIPNACLNSTISGLLSRTIHNASYIGPNDYHGAVRFEYLADEDMTNAFLDRVEEYFVDCESYNMPEIGESCIDRLKTRLMLDYPMSDIHKVKLSIGESSRALLRRIPYVMLIKNPANPDLQFVLHLAEKKGVRVVQYDTLDYECVTLLK